LWNFRPKLTERFDGSLSVTSRSVGFPIKQDDVAV